MCYSIYESKVNIDLEIWIPSVASKDLWVSGSARCLDHFIPKLTNSIQNLVEVFVHCLNGPPKGMVDNSEPLVVPYNVQEHGYLLLY